MTKTYMPAIIPEADPDVASLQDDLTRNRITHVRATDGRVWRIFDRLNKRSVPLNHVDGSGPPRIPYPKVESFGTMIDPAPEKVPEDKPDVLCPDNLLRALLQQAVIKELKKLADDDKGIIHHALANGEKRSVKNAQGAEIGSIYRTSPKPKFVIEDLAAVLPTADESEIIDLLPSNPDTPEYVRATEILREHAPELLGITLAKSERDRLASEVEERWKITGKVPAGWGIQEGKDGYTAMRPNDTGKKIVRHMLGEAQDVLKLNGGTDGEV